MPLMHLDDRVSNYRNKFKTSDNAKINSLTKKDIKELLKLQSKMDIEILEAAPGKYYDTLSLGFGTIKLSYREPIKFVNVRTKEEGMTSHTPLFYFRPSPELKARVKHNLNEVVKKKAKEKLLEKKGE